MLLAGQLEILVRFGVVNVTCSQWRETPESPEQALEMLEALDVQETRRDWEVLSMAVHKVCTLACLLLALAAIAPTIT